jgi:hypothetical protein
MMYYLIFCLRLKTLCQYHPMATGQEMTYRFHNWMHYKLADAARSLEHAARAYNTLGILTYFTSVQLILPLMAVKF